MLIKNPILILTGASGSGKTTIADYVVNKYGFAKAKTCTTRLPRAEENEHAYYFMTKNDFEQKINNGDMVEYAQIFGHYYGSQIAAFDEEIKMVVALNHSGSETLKTLYPDRVIRVMMRISREKMIERIMKRSKITHLDMMHRLDEFEILNNMSQSTIHNSFDYVVNANDSIASVTARFDQIVGLFNATSLPVSASV